MLVIYFNRSTQIIAQELFYAKNVVRRVAAPKQLVDRVKGNLVRCRRLIEPAVRHVERCFSRQLIRRRKPRTQRRFLLFRSVVALDYFLMVCWATVSPKYDLNYRRFVAG